MKTLRYALPFFYFVISTSGHFAGMLSFPDAKACLANAYAMSQQLPQDQISYCFNSKDGQPIVTDVFNDSTK